MPGNGYESRNRRHSAVRVRSFGRATAEEREILHGLTQRGAELLRETGHSADPKRIADTLRAAAVDESGRELLQLGRLSEELEASGFGGFAGMEIPARSNADAKVAKPPSPAVQRRREEQLRKLRERVTKAKRDATKAERAAGRAEAALGAARQRLVEANESVQTRGRRVEAGRGVSATRP